MSFQNQRKKHLIKQRNKLFDVRHQAYYRVRLAVYLSSILICLAANVCVSNDLLVPFSDFSHSIPPCLSTKFVKNLNWKNWKWAKYMCVREFVCAIHLLLFIFVVVVFLCSTLRDHKWIRIQTHLHYELHINARRHTNTIIREYSILLLCYYYIRASFCRICILPMLNLNYKSNNNYLSWAVNMISKFKYLYTLMHVER